jgi:hypothetical protein
VRGKAFLGALDRLCFGADENGDRDIKFVDEIDFPARHPEEQGCSPDYTIFSDDRCWIIELKTEPGSHRPRQIPDYFERAHHYHPRLRIDVTYLTAGIRAVFEPSTNAWERYVHIEWPQIAEIVRSAWSGSSDAQLNDTATMLLRGIAHLDEPPAVWWERLGYQVGPAQAPRPAATPPLTLNAGNELVDAAVHHGVLLAEATADDGKQRAIGFEACGLETLDWIRLELRHRCRSQPSGSPLRQVQPWLWNAASSGGRAMTPEGERTGYEVRLSRSRSPA